LPQRRSPAAWSAPGWTASCCDTLQTCAREKYSFIGALVYVFTLSMDLPTRVYSLRRHSTSRSAGLSVLLLASSTIRHSCKVLIAGPCFAGRARRRSRCGRACAAWPPGTAAPLPGGGETHLSRVLMCFAPHVPTAMPCPHVVHTGGSAAGTRSVRHRHICEHGRHVLQLQPRRDRDSRDTECGGGGVCEHRGGIAAVARSAAWCLMNSRAWRTSSAALVWRV
jgi:hypothetical protein